MFSITTTWERKKFRVKNGLSNKHAGLPVLTDPGRDRYNAEVRATIVLLLQRSLFVLEDAAMMLNMKILLEFKDNGLKEMETAQCISIKKETIIICYVDDSTTFAEKHHICMD